MSKSTKSVSRSELSTEKPKRVTTKKVVEETAPQVAPVPPQPKKSVVKSSSSTKSSSSSTKSSSTKSAAPPKEKKERKEKTAVPAEEEAGNVDADGVKKRREVSGETVSAEFEALLELLRENIELSRSAGGKRAGNVKLLRQLGKRLKVLRADCMRITKQRRTNRKNNGSSGFMKPVKVSDEMAKFAGWDPAQLRSRVDATKYICKYIKENSLQDPSDKRRINPDGKLTKLLGYTPSPDSPLFYYTIQQKIQKHFTNPDSK